MMVANVVRGLGRREWVAIPISFTTDGSDDPTLDDDHAGAVSIARTNTTDYQITLPEPFDYAVVIPAIGVAGTDFVDGFATDGANRTVTIETNNGLTSAECHLVIFASYRNG